MSGPGGRSPSERGGPTVKKRLIASAACLLTVFCLAVPIRAETVLTGQWVEFGLSADTKDGVSRSEGNLLFRHRGEGFDDAVVCLTNIDTETGREILVAEYEGALPHLPGDGTYAFPASDYPYPDYRVEIQWNVGGGLYEYSVVFPSPERRGDGESLDDDLTPPAVSVAPVAERMLVNASDAGVFALTGDSLSYLESFDLTWRTASSADYSGRKQISAVSEPVPCNGDWAYTFWAYDEAGNMTARSVFLHTSGIGDMQDSELRAHISVPKHTSPNTGDVSVLTAAAACVSAVLACLSFKRAKSRAGSR